VKGTVAVVGFPNVGKSTLVNRLTGSRIAVVHEQSGVTRDRKEVVAEWQNDRFLIVDTGGVDIADQSPMTQSIAAQAREGVDEADLVLFVVDAKAGITPGDEEVADILRRAGKPVLLIANKIDDPAQDSLALELHRLGLGEPIPLSALHGHGSGDLLDRIVAELPGEGRDEIPETAIRVAILGRPNVGKSSLLQRDPRARARDRAREARDDARRDRHRLRARRADVRVRRHGGMRRKRRHRQGIEYYSELRALDVAERADIALVVIDTSEGSSTMDLSVADVARQGAVRDDRRPVQVGHHDGRDRRRAPGARAPPAPAPAARGGVAEDGRGLERLLDLIERQFDRYSRARPDRGAQPVPGELQQRRETPARILYGAQVESAPAALPLHRQQPPARDARLRLLGGEPAP
jgi:GTP-binding protein